MTALASAEHAGLAGFGSALIAVLWAYEGWHIVSFTAGEFRAAQRDLPRSLISGTLFVCAIYLALNLGYYAVLPLSQLAGVASAAAAAAHAAYGEAAVRLISVLIVTSILVALNGMTLTGARVYYAMARDGVFFASLGKTSERSKVPVQALLIQCAWACVLTATGTFQQLYSSVVFTAWIFYGLAVAAVLLLRVRARELPRGFRTPFYPLTPLLFVVAAGAVVVSSIVDSPMRAAVGVGMILLGLPVYFLFRRTSARAHLTVSSMEILP